MSCERFAFSSTGSGSLRRDVRRYAAADLSVVPSIRPRLTEGGRARGVVTLTPLAAAEARIAELEAALQEAREVASHDPLTSLLNRRGMNEGFARESARAKRTGQPLAVAMIDLDDFKRINDQHGHAVGDLALIHLTEIMAATLRPTDVCCRLGGEEFVVLMPDSDRIAAKRALLRLQEALAASPVPGTEVHLTFSAGVLNRSNTESLDQLLERADSAVYRAKAAGKRRVLSA